MYITKFFLSLFKDIKYQKLLNDAYEKDRLIEKISAALGVQFRKDWIGRIYAVINPNIRDGKYSPEQIYEITESGGSDTTEFINQWVIGRLILIRNFILAENLFELLTYHNTPLDDRSNYLFVIEPITLPDVFKYGKYALVELCIIGILIATYFIFW